MTKKYWRRYIYTIVTYSDSKGEMKHLIANLMSISLFLPINFICFIMILNSSDYLLTFILAIGEGRLFLAYMMEKYKRNFGDYTPFLRYVAYLMISIVIIMGTYKLIKDVNEQHIPNIQNESLN